MHILFDCAVFAIQHHWHTAQPCLELLECQNAQWLASRRDEFGGRQTRTQQHPGILVRWDTGWVQEVQDIAGDWPNPDKDKQKTTEKANALYAVRVAELPSTILNEIYHWQCTETTLHVLWSPKRSGMDP